MSDAIAIPFRVFSDADTAVGKLLQFGKEGVTEFLKGGLSKFSGGLPTIDGLKDFANRFKRVSDVADLLFKPENVSIANALMRFPEAVSAILNLGSDAVQVLTQRLNMGDNLNLLAQRLAGVSSSEGAAILTRIQATPLQPQSLIVDTNVTIALETQRLNPNALSPGNRAVINRINSIGSSDLRLTDTVSLETGGNQPFRGITITVDRNGAEYSAVLQKLANPAHSVGGTGGVADRAIVADVFLQELNQALFRNSLLLIEGYTTTLLE
ncbi:MAG: hypothetical protein HC780_13495 [Leptolyngbyaceae cyanobacterium CSU_1_3]|nr:hypothetical protein [Leptolyngbyaceae cyanobacterium CSU_1_3]